MTSSSPSAPPAGFGDPTCLHAVRESGVCVRCGHCVHELVLNGACYFCGTTDLDPIALSPKQLIPAEQLLRKK